MGSVDTAGVAFTVGVSGVVTVTEAVPVAEE
jgi:hypothetical protein